jgi:ABC-type iron transport system FetAB permease component
MLSISYVLKLIFFVEVVFVFLCACTHMSTHVHEQIHKHTHTVKPKCDAKVFFHFFTVVCDIILMVTRNQYPETI